MITQKHKEDLLKSGITLDVAKKNNIESMTGGEATEELGIKVINECLRIPVYGLDGDVVKDNFDADLVRYRIYDNKDCKYLSAIGAGFAPYFPNGTFDLIQKRSNEGLINDNLVVITEGEKKAIRGYMSDIPTIGLPGVWQWFDSSNKDLKDLDNSLLGIKNNITYETKLHDSFFELNNIGITVFMIIFDSDAKDNPQVRNAANTLKNAIEHQINGSTAIVSFIPSKKGSKSKIGLDDYLVAGNSYDELVNKILEVNAKKVIVEETSTIKEGYIPLGYYEDRSVIYSNARKTVFELTPSNMTPNYLTTYTGDSFLNANYSYDKVDGTTAIDYNKAGIDIINKCTAMGYFKSESVRGSGIWKDEKDSSKLIISSSDKLIDSNNNTLDRFIDGIIYPIDTNLNIDYSNEKVGTVEDIKRILQSLKTWNFENEVYSKLLLGWVAHSVTCAANDWRSHAYITGPAGSGKSYMVNFLHKLLYTSAFREANKSSEASIRRMFGRGAYPLFLDEYEADNEKTKDLQELVRSASAGTIVSKADTKGKGELLYTVRFNACMAGIRTPNFETADSTRIIVFKLNEVSKNIEADDLVEDDFLAHEYGTLLINRMIKNWDRTQRVVDSFRKAIKKVGEDDRYAKTIGNILSGYWVATRDDELTEEMAYDIYLNEIKPKLSETVNIDMDQSIKEETLLVEFLSTKMVNFYTGVDNKHSSKQLGVLISESVLDKHIYNELLNYGIKTDFKDDKLSIIINTRNSEFRKLLTGTKYLNSNIDNILSRINGSSRVSSARFHSNTSPIRNCIKIPFYYSTEDK